MRLFLHIGTHKTGTTHLQAYLREHEAALARQGLLYPDVGPWFSRPPSEAHHQLVGIPSTDSGKRFKLAQEKLRELRENAAPGQSVLISAESMYRRTYPDDAPAATLWEGRKAYVERLRELFSGFDVKVVLCLRARPSFGESHYGSVIKTGSGLDFGSYLKDHGFMFDYDRQTQLFESVFGPVHVYRFEEALADGGVVAGFLKQLGYEAPVPDDKPATRKSPDPRLLVWLSRENAKDADDERNTRGLRIRFAGSPRAAAHLPDEVKSTLWNEASMEFLKGFPDEPPFDAKGRPYAATPTDLLDRLTRDYNAWLDAGAEKADLRAKRRS